MLCGGRRRRKATPEQPVWCVSHGASAGPAGGGSCPPGWEPETACVLRPASGTRAQQGLWAGEKESSKGRGRGESPGAGGGPAQFAAWPLPPPRAEVGSMVCRGPTGQAPPSRNPQDPEAGHTRLLAHQTQAGTLRPWVRPVIWGRTGQASETLSCRW